jgi:hypothetical protein
VAILRKVYYVGYIAETSRTDANVKQRVLKCMV